MAIMRLPTHKGTYGALEEVCAEYREALRRCWSVGVYPESEAVFVAQSHTNRQAGAIYRLTKAQHNHRTTCSELQSFTGRDVPQKFKAYVDKSGRLQGPKEPWLSWLKRIITTPSD